MKNRHSYKSHILEEKFRKIIKCFAKDLAREKSGRGASGQMSVFGLLKK